jgi:sodium/potassium-transporting ATPase subunit alpha
LDATDVRTLSIHVTESQNVSSASAAEKKKDAVKELASLDWHTHSVEEVLTRLSVSPKAGLDTEQAARRLKANGANVVSPPPKNHLRK